MTRLYFSKRMDELEALYESNGHDSEILRELLVELEHRSTQRAGKLRELIRPRLHDFAENSPQPRTVETPETAAPEMEPQQRGTGASEAPPTAEQFAELDDDFWEQPIEASKSITSAPDESVQIDNAPLSVIDAWIALEVLSPQSYSRPADLANGDFRCVAKLNNGLPWLTGPETARPNTRLFYHIVLGSIRLDMATADLLRAFGDQRPERPRTKDNAALAVLTVDKLGRPAGDNPISVSSFGYGYQKACQGEFDALRHWGAVEEKIIDKLRQFLIQHSDDEQEVQPVSIEQISKASQWLANGFRIPDSHFIKPRFAIRTYQWFMAPKPPEPLLLNSFFLSDLRTAANVVTTDSAGKALRRYLGIEKPSSPVDLLSDKHAIEALVAPKNIPFARWPAAGRHSLVLLQQAAVNLAFTELEKEGLIGINGPPGTGKTTLLRDIVAGVVANRADVLCKFDNPEKAFKHAGQFRNGKSFAHLYSIDDSLSGHEIFVASSNNKAVENISREIPEIEHIEKSRAPDYFSSIADNVAGEDGRCWGMAAAVMGNAANRVAFYKKFWTDPNRGMRQYLWACQGNDATLKVTEPESGDEIEVEAEVVTREAPPVGHSDALAGWKSERREYQHVAKNAKQAIKELEEIRQKVLRSLKLEKSHGLCTAQLDGATLEANKALLQFQQALQQLTELQEIATTANSTLAKHVEQKPSFFSRLLRSDPWRRWKYRKNALSDDANRVNSQLAEHKRVSEQTKEVLEATKTHQDEARSRLEDLALQRESVEKELGEAESSLGKTFAGSSFWIQEHDDLQTSVAWLDAETQRLRDHVFVAAFVLHKAFISAAAKPIRNNLQTLFSVLLGSSLDETKRKHLPSLWSSLFLIVPVVSTTFASVSRMLGPLPSGSIGWLLIDEAGQASPQMAVGALMRARRACVVGDPLQIEPVVTLSSQLVSRISRKFGVSPADWMAPMSSVQELADAASDHATWIERHDGSVRVGAPLLVHRRCVEPMFGISNSISYANLMVQATKPENSRIQQIIGASQWIDVHGSSRFKWSAKEGEKVVELLSSLVNAGAEKPDIFVISPFRSVAQGLRNRLRNEHSLLGQLSSEPDNWLYDRVGTVHTFQGKQAEAVILVLGAQDPSETFARKWAGHPPNLINVAVSRAKSVLYVIGNRQIWRDVGALSQVSSRLK